MGLPRIMSEETEVLGQVFPAGTILSVPSYTLHHLESTWTDPFVYRPERWLEEGSKELEKSLNSALLSCLLSLERGLMDWTQSSRTALGPASEGTSL